MGFFTWHARLEANHARHTWQELEDFCAQQAVDENAFIRNACEMLDGVMVFWRGLDEQRRALGRRNAACPGPLSSRRHGAPPPNARALRAASRVSKCASRNSWIKTANPLAELPAFARDARRICRCIGTCFSRASSTARAWRCSERASSARIPRASARKPRPSASARPWRARTCSCARTARPERCSCAACG